MSDLISRADAIESVCGVVIDEFDVSPTLGYEVAEKALKALPSADAVDCTDFIEWLTEVVLDDEDWELNAVAYGEIICRKLEKLGVLEVTEEPSYYIRPSAEAVQGWIPCSERLPSESDDYICTIPLDADETYTEVLTFHKGRFYEDDDEWGATYHDDVLAWMPLPKPYRDESEVEE